MKREGSFRKHLRTSPVTSDFTKNSMQKTAIFSRSRWKALYEQSGLMLKTACHVKFDEAKVTEYMRDVLGITDGEATSTITGELVDGTPFGDNETIGVISKGEK